MKAGLYRAIDKKVAQMERDQRTAHRALVGQLENVGVELKKLRAQVDALRGEYERHTHELFTDGSDGNGETYPPAEVRTRDKEEWRERMARLSNEREPGAKDSGPMRPK